MNLDGQSGAGLAQLSIHPNTLEDLTIAGVTENRVYVHVQDYSLTALGGIHVGSFDLNLQNSTWKKLSFNKFGPSKLVYDAGARSLLFSDAPSGESRVDAIRLGLDLEPLVDGPLGLACQFFTEATLVPGNPNMAVQKMELTQSALSVSVHDTTLPLLPSTRIKLG
jgi:hypothetical protein